MQLGEWGEFAALRLLARHTRQGQTLRRVPLKGWYGWQSAGQMKNSGSAKAKYRSSQFVAQVT